MQNKDDKATNMIAINSQNSVECAENLISLAIIKSADSKWGRSSGVGSLERGGQNCLRRSRATKVQAENNDLLK